MSSEVGGRNLKAATLSVLPKLRTHLECSCTIQSRLRDWHLLNLITLLIINCCCWKSGKMEKSIKSIIVSVVQFQVVLLFTMFKLLATTTHCTSLTSYIMEQFGTIVFTAPENIRFNTYLVNVDRASSFILIIVCTFLSMDLEVEQHSDHIFLESVD